MVGGYTQTDMTYTNVVLTVVLAGGRPFAAASQDLPWGCPWGWGIPLVPSCLLVLAGPYRTLYRRGKVYEYTTQTQV